MPPKEHGGCKQFGGSGCLSASFACTRRTLGATHRFRQDVRRGGQVARDRLQYRAVVRVFLHFDPPMHIGLFPVDARQVLGQLASGIRARPRNGAGLPHQASRGRTPRVSPTCTITRTASGSVSMRRRAQPATLPGMSAAQVTASQGGDPIFPSNPADQKWIVGANCAILPHADSRIGASIIGV